jgi:flagellin
MSMNANRALGKNTTAQQKSLEKLSSGLAINRAADDAAGLSISESMRTQISGLERASKNTQDGISFIQTAEGALDEVNTMLTRLEELAVEAGDGVLQTNDIANINEEMTQLKSEINDIISNTKFNSVSISSATSIVVDDSGTTVSIGTAISLTLTTDISGIKKAVSSITTIRAKLGAQQNRLESKYNNLKSTTENLQSAEAQIRDTDMASEMSDYNKTSILVQAATSMIAQANSAPQTVLSLLQ